MCNMIHYLFMYLTILLCLTPIHSNKLDAFWTPNIDCTASSPDPCSLLVDICKPHGQCVPQGQCNYRCVCEGGFEGADCQTPSQSSIVDPGPEPSGTSNSKRLDIIVGNGALNFLDSLLKESTTSAKVLTTTDAATTTFTTMTQTKSTVNTLDSQVQESLPQSQALKSPEQNDTVVSSNLSLTKSIEETSTVTSIAVQKDSLKAIDSSMITTTTPTNLPTTEIEQLSTTSTPPPSLATTDIEISPPVNQNLKEYTTVKPEETLMAEQALKPETTKPASFEPQPVEERKQVTLSNKETVETTTDKEFIGSIVTLDNTTSAINDSSTTSPTSSVLLTTSKSTETGNEQVNSVRSDAIQKGGPITSTDKPSSKSVETETTKTTQTLRSTKIPVTTQQKLVDLTTTVAKIESPFVKAPPTQTTLNQESTLSLLSSLVSELKTLTENLPRTLGLRPVTQPANNDQTSSKSTIEITVSTPSLLQSNSSALSATTLSKEAPLTTTNQPTLSEDIMTNKPQVTAALDTKSLINKPSSPNVEESTTLKPRGPLPLPLTHLPVLSVLLDPNFRKFTDPKSPSQNTPPTPFESKVQESSILGIEATEKSTSTVSISTTNSKTTTEIPKATTNSFVSQDNVLISAAASKKSKLIDVNQLTAAGDRPPISAKTFALPGDSVYLAMSPSTTPNPTTSPIMTTTFDVQFIQGEKTQPLLLIKNNEKNKESTLPDVNDTPIHPWKSGQFVESHNTDNNNIVPNTVRGHMTRKGKITKDIPEDSLHALSYAPEIRKVKSSTPSFIYSESKNDVTNPPYFTTTTSDSKEESGDDTLSSSYTTPDSKTADSDDITTPKETDYETSAADLPMSPPS